MKPHELTHEMILKRVEYDPLTGVFTRIKYHGRVSGTPDKDGYLQISVHKVKYQAWVAQHGLQLVMISLENAGGDQHDLKHPTQQSESLPVMAGGRRLCPLSNDKKAGSSRRRC